MKAKNILADFSGTYFYTGCLWAQFKMLSEELCVFHQQNVASEPLGRFWVEIIAVILHPLCCVMSPSDCIHSTVGLY